MLTDILLSALKFHVSILVYKCIWDDTKATARRSPNCIRKTKIKYGTEWFSIWRMEFFHPAMWHMALGSWHWIRPNVRHIGILLPVSISTISPQSTCGAPVCEILSKSDYATAEKLHHVDFRIPSKVHELITNMHCSNPSFSVRKAPSTL